ncbi:MAG: hypothetical protein ACXW2P_05460 [Thermoanaerobaculia bacterium]
MRLIMPVALLLFGFAASASAQNTIPNTRRHGRMPSWYLYLEGVRTAFGSYADGDVFMNTDEPSLPLPLYADLTATVTFRTGDEPSVTLEKGYSNADRDVFLRIHYRTLPANAACQLSIEPERSTLLLCRGELIQPSSVEQRDPLAGRESPTVQITLEPAADGRRVRIVPSRPVSMIEYSLDGISFTEYAGPFTVGPDVVTVFAFANDLRSNPSAIHTLRIADPSPEIRFFEGGQTIAFRFEWRQGLRFFHSLDGTRFVESDRGGTAPYGHPHIFVYTEDRAGNRGRTWRLDVPKTIARTRPYAGPTALIWDPSPARVGRQAVFKVRLVELDSNRPIVGAEVYFTFEGRRVMGLTDNEGWARGRFLPREPGFFPLTMTFNGSGALKPSSYATQAPIDAE